jgi:hypothetical protein
MRRLQISEFAKLDTIADALQAASSCRFADQEDGRQYLDERGTVVRIRCGYGFHYAYLLPSQHTPGRYEWYADPACRES